MCVFFKSIFVSCQCEARKEHIEVGLGSARVVTVGQSSTKPSICRDRCKASLASILAVQVADNDEDDSIDRAIRTLFWLVPTIPRLFFRSSMRFEHVPGIWRTILTSQCQPCICLSLERTFAVRTNARSIQKVAPNYYA